MDNKTKITLAAMIIFSIAFGLYSAKFIYETGYMDGELVARRKLDDEKTKKDD